MQYACQFVLPARRVALVTAPLYRTVKVGHERECAHQAEPASSASER
jgi:hypothetical protein